MKRFLFHAIAAAALALASPAFAADMPLKAPAPLAVSAPSNFYIGGFAAGAKTKADFDFVAIPGTGNLHPTGFMPGAVIGVGFWSGATYFAVEADAAYDFIKTDNPCVIVLNCKIENSFFLTQRGIFGIALPAITGAVQSRAGSSAGVWPTTTSLPVTAWASQIMPYVTAGVAERRIEACIDAALIGGPKECAKEWIVGWTAGAGLRVPISTHVSLDLTYLYVGWNKSFVPTSNVSIFPATFEAKSEQVGRAGLLIHF